MKMSPPKFEMCQDGRKRMRVTVSMDICYDHLHIAAYMTPGIIKRPNELTRADVMRQLDMELRAGGLLCHEGEESCTDAEDIEDNEERTLLDNIAYSNARLVVLRLWPELCDDPEIFR